jgi:uncharacterized protein (DUF1684 family)
MKMNSICCAFLALLLSACGKPTATGPVAVDQATVDAITKEIEKERSETREWLKSSPSSYLAATDRVDFGRKPTLSVGRAEGNDVRLSSEDVAPHHLKITVEGDRFRVEAVDPNSSFKIGEETKREATVDPSSIQVGRFRLRLSHQRFPAVIVFDPQSPRFKEYKGIDYFPVDLSYRYELPLQRDPKAEKFVILSTRGHQRKAERVGWFEFRVGETICRLEATRLLEPGAGGEEALSVFFRDATSGTESYPLGRYVDAKKLPNGRYLLDFNTAYNPACAFSDYYNCPVPPKANTLAVAIRAGEKDSHYH